MSIQVLTEAPGGYVNMEASEVVGANRWRTTNDVRVRFRNGDFVIVSGDVARGLERLGIIGASRRFGAVSTLSAKRTRLSNVAG